MAGYPGRQGAKPKPTALKALHGTLRRDRSNTAEPQPVARLPKPPPELGDAARREWRRTGRKLLALGLMTEVDAAAFAGYCETYSRWLDVIDKLNRSGVLLKDEKLRFRVNPLVAVARDLQSQWMRALVEFGMSPSSRARVHAAPPVERDALSEFLRGG